MIYVDWYYSTLPGMIFYRSNSLDSFISCGWGSRHEYRTFKCKRLVWEGGRE